MLFFLAGNLLFAQERPKTKIPATTRVAHAGIFLQADEKEVPKGTEVQVELASATDPKIVASARCEVRTSCFISLVAPGSYWLSSRSRKVWSPERLISVEAGKTRDVSLDLIPTALLHGRLVGAPEGDEPDSLTARFRENKAGKADETNIQGEIAVPVKNGEFSFAVPARTVDLKLRVKGYVSHHFWGLKLRVGEDRDLGKLKLVPGASVVGWLTRDEVSKSFEKVILNLKALAGDPLARKDAAAAKGAHFSTHARANGFFGFEEVPAGAYEVSAKDPDGLSARFAPVNVYEGSESELQQPLHLLPPSKVEVWVDPPLGPDDKPWKISLSEMEATPGRLRQAGEEETGVGGVGIFSGVRQGFYRLQITAQDGSNWYYGALHVEREEEFVPVSISEIKVKGTVFLGDDPVISQIWFGGSDGAVKRLLKSDEEGRFRGILPHDGRWLVEVSSAEGLRYTAFLKVEKGHDIKIRIPNTSVSGSVTDADGKPVAHASVSAGCPEMPVPVRTSSEDDGSFSLTGLSEGMCSLVAQKAQSRSEPQDVNIGGNEDVEGVKLVLKEEPEIRGKVIGPSGGVPGCFVSFKTATDLNAGGTSITNAEGRFQLFFSSKDVGGFRVAQVILMPPGYDFSARRIEIPKNGEGLNLEVSNRGGTLELKLGSYEEQGTMPFLVHNGIAFPLPMIFRWAHMLGTPWAYPATRITVGHIEAGDWSLCASSPADPHPKLNKPQTVCDQGFLNSGGQLSLELD